MAARGPKPKPGHLRLVQGTHRPGRHGDAEEVLQKAEASVATFGKIVRPKHLKGDAKKAWDKWIAPAPWLDASKEAAAISFCELWDEFMEAPKRFVAAKHGQMRAYMSELGLTDERNRGNHGEEEKDEFFDA